MFHPGSPERGGEYGPHRKEILKMMKVFCRYHNIKPLKVFDGEKGITFIFPLDDQKLSEVEIWESSGMKQIKDFFVGKGYFVAMRKFTYNMDVFMDKFRFGEEKIHLFIGFEPVQSMMDIVNQQKSEIDFKV